MELPEARSSAPLPGTRNHVRHCSDRRARHHRSTSGKGGHIDDAPDRLPISTILTDVPRFGSPQPMEKGQCSKRGEEKIGFQGIRVLVNKCGDSVPPLVRKNEVGGDDEAYAHP